MATLTIRNLEEALKQRLRIQAASHNRSMEEEVRRILRKAVLEENESEGPGTHIHRREPDPLVLAWMDRLPRNQLGISSITIAEILYGIGSLPQGKSKEQLLAAAAMFDDDFVGRIFPFDGPAEPVE